jgi:hypothetical protein
MRQHLSSSSTFRIRAKRATRDLAVGQDLGREVKRRLVGP